MIADLRRKIKRFKPLLATKKAVLEQETMALTDLQRQHEEASLAVQQYKQQYLSAVDRLNTARVQCLLGQSVVLEQRSDFCRAKWTEQIRTVDELSAKIAAQTQVVLDVQAAIKALNNLIDRSNLDLRRELERSATAQQDDLTSMGIARRGRL